MQLCEPGVPVGPDRDVVHGQHHVDRAGRLPGVVGDPLQPHRALLDEFRAAPPAGREHHLRRVDPDDLPGAAACSLEADPGARAKDQQDVMPAELGEPYEVPLGGGVAPPSASPRPADPGRGGSWRSLILAAEDGSVYGVARDGPNLALPLRGRDGLRQRLARAYHRKHGGAATGAALSDALAVLEGMGAECQREQVALRLARHGDAIVIDLATTDGRCVIVTAGQRRVAMVPILFRRTA